MTISANLMHSPPLNPIIAHVLIPIFLASLSALTTFCELPLPDRAIKRSSSAPSVFSYLENTFSYPVSLARQVLMDELAHSE